MKLDDDHLAAAAGMTKLKRLELNNCAVPAAGLKALREALPKCEIAVAGKLPAPKVEPKKP
jgi:hypothetical protein